MLKRLKQLFERQAYDDAVARGADAIMTLMLSDQNTASHVAEILLDTSDNVLKKADPLLKARVLQRLSAEIGRLEASSQRIPAKLRRAGYKLVRQTQMPESVATRMRAFEDEMVERTADLFPATTFLQPDQKVSQKDAVQFCRDFVDHFADVYGIERGIAFRPLEPENAALHGQVYWDEGEGIAVVQAKLTKSLTRRGLALLVVTLGHECVHAAANTMHYGGSGSWERVRDTQPEAYVFHAVTDSRFYTSEDREIHRNHPEEVLAERVGLRLGVQIAQTLGITPDLESMAQETLGVIPRAEVVRELASLYRAPTPRGRPSAPCGQG